MHTCTPIGNPASSTFTSTTTMASARRCLCLVAVLLAAATVAVMAAAPSAPDDDPGMPMSIRHQCWMARIGRTYADAAEKVRRFEVFRANAERIDSANREGNLTYTLGLTPFADLTVDEFRIRHLMLDVAVDEPAAARRLFEEEKVHRPVAVDAPAPPSVDWRTLGAVTKVMDQDAPSHLQCNSCWAFAATAAAEGLIKIKTGRSVSLSAQQVLDCTGGDNTCKGGHIHEALRYIATVGGRLSTDGSYPYREARGACSSSSGAASSTGAVITGVKKVRPHDKEALRAAVARQPVAADMDSGDDHFKNYKRGVYRGSGSCGKKRNHAVAVVGYGTASDGTQYWLLKNSWGASWGEGGYMRIAVDADCAVSNRPAYPI